MTTAKVGEEERGNQGGQGPPSSPEEEAEQFFIVEGVAVSSEFDAHDVMNAMRRARNQL